MRLKASNHRLCLEAYFATRSSQPFEFVFVYWLLMSSSRKLDAKNYATMRAWLKEEGNKHCFDWSVPARAHPPNMPHSHALRSGEKGPSYVVVPLSTFVCTKCAGLQCVCQPPQMIPAVRGCFRAGCEARLLLYACSPIFRPIMLTLSFPLSPPVLQQPEHAAQPPRQGHLHVVLHQGGDG